PCVLVYTAAAPWAPIGNFDWSWSSISTCTANSPWGADGGGGLKVGRLPLGNIWPWPVPCQMLFTFPVMICPGYRSNATSTNCPLLTYLRFSWVYVASR